ncbi:MAG: ribosomal protein small subunit ribosomal protein [Parcubacteria group bacterium]|nr:ribosomal protein small subunit ribosomal protein [Parcubacteria group bacterium]
MDVLGNMIIAIKNAGNAGRDTVTVPYSKMKENITTVLTKEGFIKGAQMKMVSGKPTLVITLILENRIPKVKGVQRISKTSKRVYKKSSEIRLVKSGYGALILSTPKGIMSGRDARKEKLGGEALFTIW